MIEVDIVPVSTICEENIYNNLNMDTHKNKKKAEGN